MIRAVPLTIRFEIRDTKVLWISNGTPLLEMHWGVARELGRALQRPKLLPPPKPFEFRTSIGGGVERVIVLGGGRLLADPPLDAAAKLGALLIGKAGQAEEIENATKVPVSFAEGAAPSIIADAALAARSGAPFGLTDNPKIQEEAKKEALGNRDLRRFLPEMKGTAILGAPRVRQYSADPKQAAQQTLADMTPDQRFALARQALNPN